MKKFKLNETIKRWRMNDQIQAWVSGIIDAICPVILMWALVWAPYIFVSCIFGN